MAIHIRTEKASGADKNGTIERGRKKREKRNREKGDRSTEDDETKAFRIGYCRFRSINRCVLGFFHVFVFLVFFSVPFFGWVGGISVDDV